MLLLPCSEATRLFSQGMDRKLPVMLRIVVWLHIYRCKACQRFRQQMYFLRNTLQKHPEHMLSEESPQQPELSQQGGLSPEARERIKRALRHQQE